MTTEQHIEISRLMHEALFRAFDHGQVNAYAALGHYADVVIVEAEQKRREATNALDNAIASLLPGDAE